MSLFSIFARNPAPTGKVARDRLQILLAHERSSDSKEDSELIRKLHNEIMEVLKRHVMVDQDKVQIKLDRELSGSTLAIDIELPKKEKEKPPLSPAPRPSVIRK